MHEVMGRVSDVREGGRGKESPVTAWVVAAVCSGMEGCVIQVYVGKSGYRVIDLGVYISIWTM